MDSVTSAPRGHSPASRWSGAYGGSVNAIALTADGSLLAAGSMDGSIAIWDTQLRSHVATPLGHRQMVRSVAFSPDGALLASTGVDRQVIVWDLRTFRRLSTLSGHQDEVYRVAFSPDGKRLVSAGADRSVMLWDTATFEPVATLQAHRCGVTGLAFGSDGKRLASWSHDGTVIHWDAAAGVPAQITSEPKVYGHCAPVSGNGPCDRNAVIERPEFGPDLKQLVGGLGCTRQLIVCDVEDVAPPALLDGQREGVWSLAISADGTHLASGSVDGGVLLWDLPHRKALARLDGHQGRIVTALAFSADGRQLAAAGGTPVLLWRVEP